MSKLDKLKNFLNKDPLIIIFFVVFYFVSSYMLIYTSITPPKFDLKAGDVAPQDIKAPKDVIDVIATQKKIQEAVNAVNPKYDYNENIAKESYLKLADFFNKLREVRKSSESEEQKLQDFKNITPINLEDKNIAFLLKIDDSTLIKMETVILSAEKAIMARQITEDALQSALNDAKSVVESSDIPVDAKPVAVEILSSVIVPNMIYNAYETNLAKKEAEEKVQPVMYKKGQNIVVSGEIVTPEQIEVLKSLGLLKGTDKIDYALIVGLFLILSLSLFLSVYYIIRLDKKIATKKMYIELLCLTGILYLVLAVAFKGIEPLLIPAAMLPMLVSILIDPYIAIMVDIIYSLLVGLMVSFNQAFIFMSLLGGLIGAIKLSSAKQRMDFVKAGLYVSAVNLVSIVGVGLLNSNDIVSVLKSGLWGIINGVFSIILVIGTLPFWEAAFDILTPLKLLELSNPNNPLLKKLMMDAPGTYHHSMIVANLAEAASDAVGANSLLVRVGAYYHDIGKIKRPYFFKENQLSDENLHDKISPDLSTLVIISHVKDGVELAKKYKLPPQIIDMIKEHHGTTLVKYFYNKALQKEEGVCEEESFRYPGPKPSTKESAILMLADSVEAAVRSLSDPTEENVRNMIEKIVTDRLNDGQLSNSDLTLKDIETIKASFLNSLAGMFHKRIEYPDIETNQNKEVLE
ncbi:MAG: putative membrane-associated HD superfamily hydrolase [Caldanaerobacter subterraneus]|uniref:Phosphohydrolase n=1 Tax=Caldanaerobacter subterraneus TaxID=911092 RepID=A0A101E5W0_9THEO|nr:HDIG domain-containing metalloprotein [Caldanaerobacter subterraneus]KUK09243.1 MAG: putative membrane-associated HD superfamily hydrolase [Caldanaerobacter subterraneus]MDK2794540.1 cyclic-di-AMP phosphodiesterase PgpH [Caldanaerobacter sp.]HBT50323.1 phosphohydrolase [Caldanaerobacter subterraneus]